MLKCAAIFTDHMVLLRDKRICVWGECDGNGTVMVSVDDIKVNTEVADGLWKVYLPPHKVGGPFQMTVSHEEEQICFSDVMYGEVLLAAGQSNMEWSLAGSQDGELEVQESKYPDIRFYNTYKTGYIDADVEAQIREQTWNLCVDGQSRNMSAVAYYAAKCIYEKLNIPLGIIDCYQGGTSISSWLSYEDLSRYTCGLKFINDYKALVGDKTDEEYDREVEDYWRRWHAWDDKVKEYTSMNPDAAWEEITQYAGESPWPQPAGNKSQFRPTGCYDTMIKQIAPYTISGIMYYQGETDAEMLENVSDYYDLMDNLIRDWRRMFENRDLFFVLTQLPMYIDKDAEDDYTWAEMRNQQLAIFENVRNTSLLVLGDCGEYGNIHPVDKKTPGTRLGKLLLEKLYNADAQGEAMYPQEIIKDGDRIIITCRNTYGKIIIDKDENYNYSEPFEIAGSDGIYRKCHFTVDTDSIILEGDYVSTATKVRYAWWNYGKIMIFNAAHIPLAPFGERCVR